MGEIIKLPEFCFRTEKRRRGVVLNNYSIFDQNNSIILSNMSKAMNDRNDSLGLEMIFYDPLHESLGIQVDAIFTVN